MNMENLNNSSTELPKGGFVIRSCDEQGVSIQIQGQMQFSDGMGLLVLGVYAILDNMARQSGLLSTEDAWACFVNATENSKESILDLLPKKEGTK